MLTNLNFASTENTNILMTKTQMEEMQESVTIKVYKFKGLSKNQRTEMFTKPEMDSLWKQLKDICRNMVGKTYILGVLNNAKSGATGMYTFDYAIILSTKKYVLAYAMVTVENIKYDDVTVKRLIQMPDKFDVNTTLNIKLLCSREGSGMGSHIVRVCENLGIRLKCASLHLDAVPTAYGFYKSVGFVPFNETKLACIKKYQPDEVDKFTDAILKLQDKLKDKKDKLKELRKNGKGKGKGKGKEIPTAQEILSIKDSDLILSTDTYTVKEREVYLCAKTIIGKIASRSIVYHVCG